MISSPLAPLAAAALLLASPVALAAPPAAPRRVAVLDFSASWAGECSAGPKVDPAQREQCELLRILADQARGGALAALGPPAFVVMTRENTAQILKDMGGACVEGECEVETARLIGASVVVSGEVSLMEGSWIVSLKAHDVATAALLATGNVQARTKLELFGSVRAETERMLRATVGNEAVGFPGFSPPAVVGDELPAEPSRATRLYLSFQAGTGVAWGPIEGLSGRALGDGQMQGAVGYRLSQEWAIEAGGGYVNFFKDDLPGTSDFVEVKSFSFLGAAAWRSPGLRYFSFAAEAGYDATSYRLTADSVADDSASKGMLHAGIEARADWPLGPVALGLRAGIRVYRQGVSRVSDGLRWVDAGVIVVLPAAVAATVYF